MGVFDDIIGPFVIVSILNGVLCGITITQVFTYYSTTTGDRKIFVWAVFILTVIDILHTIMSSYTVYHWCVTHFGDVTVLVSSPWSFTYECGLTGIATIIVQAFFAYRVWAISGHSLILPGLISFFSLVSFGFALGATIEIVHLHGDFTRFGVWTYGVVLWLAPSAMADVLITGSMVYFLRRNLSETQKIHSVIDAIIRNTVETNGITMAVCLIATFVFSFGPGTWHVLPQILLQKLYFNSFLVSLNSRKAVSARMVTRSPSANVNFGRNGIDNDSPRLVNVTITKTVETSRIDEKDLDYEDSESPSPERNVNDLEMNAITPRRPVAEAGW